MYPAILLLAFLSALIVVWTVVRAPKEKFSTGLSVVKSSDVLRYSLLPAGNQRVICVKPNETVAIYVLERPQGRPGGLLIGPADALRPVQQLCKLGGNCVGPLVVYKGNSNGFKAAAEGQKHVIVYDDGGEVAQQFWEWLNASSHAVVFSDLFGLAQNKDKVYNKFPFVSVVTKDITKLVPNRKHTVANQFVPVLEIPVVLYGIGPFHTDFLDVYDGHVGLLSKGTNGTNGTEAQQFYELFLYYYDEILTQRVHVQSSTVLKNYIEAFGEEADFLVSVPMKTLVVAQANRNSFKEMHVSHKELSGALGAALSPRDKVAFTSQKHRSLDGLFIVVAIDEHKVVLQTKIKIEALQVLDFDALRLRVQAKSAQTTGNVTLQKDDLVWIVEVDRPGAVVEIDKTSIVITIIDDVASLDNLYRCVTQPSTRVKAACISKYDEFGALKPGGIPDVWDRPCLYDEECPFFGKGARDKFRGGCSNGGYCEMPLGYALVGQRTYAREKEAHDAEEEIRFAGDVWATNIYKQ